VRYRGGTFEKCREVNREGLFCMEDRIALEEIGGS